ncbi:MAG: hypothetical protein HY924_06410 [Elusimicrobia bacterium]|nr:hypothetical protein [Elusimicrobiota bacterium]
MPVSTDPLSSLWVHLATTYWWVAPLVIAVVFLRPWLVRLIRWAGRRFFVGLRTSGVNRTPGMLYCAQCGAMLAPEMTDGVFAVQSCPHCGGKWCAGERLHEEMVQRNRALTEWATSKEKAAKDDLPCPKCFTSMQCGSFAGSRATTFRCEPCDGYWFSRIDWVSFELGL